VVDLIVAVPREIVLGERRVALVPSVAGKLVKKGLTVVVQTTAGEGAGYRDSDYAAQGARIEMSPEALFGSADVVLKVQPPTWWNDGRNEADLIKEDATLISFLFPLTGLDVVRRLKQRRITSFAMELMPRITRAQSMDALSSMSSIAGYRAVLIAATLLPRYFPLLMTAAGTVQPARVLILGAGVAGLQAIGTARRLGAIVEAFDVRGVVKEQVESLGARFVELGIDTSGSQDAGGYAKEQAQEMQERMRKALATVIAKADVVISTALVPGKRAPLLITGEAVRGMRMGSVIVDLAAEQGGNCEWTVAGETVVRDGVTITGPQNLPSGLAMHASDLYSRNVSAFLEHLVPKTVLAIDLEDELTRGPIVTRGGEILHAPTREAIDAQARVSAETA
jgi:NAD(P) transhydrogenase subunit alpha